MRGPLAFVAIQRLVRAFPYPVGNSLAARAAIGLSRCTPRRRALLRRNLAGVLGESASLDEVVDRALANSGRLLHEMLRGPANPEVDFRIEGVETLDRALARGRGIVLALPHLGNWEIAGCRLAARGTPVVSVAGIQLHPAWTHAIRTSRAAEGITIVPANRSGLRALDEALLRREIVALHVDGDQFRRGVDVSIAGHRVEFPVGPARLAARHAAPLVFGYCLRRGDGEQVGRVVREILVPDDSPESIRDATIEVARLFEAAVTAHPDEWTMFRDFFAVRGSRAFTRPLSGSTATADARLEEEFA